MYTTSLKAIMKHEEFRISFLKGTTKIFCQREAWGPLEAATCSIAVCYPRMSVKRVDTDVQRGCRVKAA